MRTEVTFIFGDNDAQYVIESSLLCNIKRSEA
jgi:hypothetical protein